MSSFRNEKGSVLVFITLMIVLLMIMVGMGLDTGHLSFTRTTGQGAVDAAALSAITALPEAQTKSDASIVHARAAAGYLAANNYTGSADNAISSSNVSFVQYDFDNNAITQYNSALSTANGVRVALEQSAGTAMKTPAFLTPFFRLFGQTAQSSNNVSVSAVSVMSVRPSIPIAMWQSQCLPGGATNPGVKLAQQNIKDGENSCWTTYLDKSSGAVDIEALFVASKTCNGLPVGAVDIGIPIWENKGGVVSVYDAAEALFKAYPGQCWTIPVIAKSTTNCNEKDPTPILDWAKVCNSVAVKKGGDSYIQVDVTCNQRLENPNSLCFSNRLVREPAKGM